MTTVHGSNGVTATVSRMDRVVVTMNRVVYPAWTVIAVYRESTLGAMLAALFRTGAVPARQVAMLQMGVLGGTACAVIEMAVTAAVFCRSLFLYRENCARIVACAKGHAGFIDSVGVARMRAKLTARQDHGCVDDAERERRTEVELPWEAGRADEADPREVRAPLLGGEAGEGRGPAGTEPESEHIATQVQDYAAHRAAMAAEPEHRRVLCENGLAFGRDTVVQGGAAGSNLALLWHAFGVSRLLHLPADVVSMGGATVAGSICSLIMGAIHVVAAAVSWRGALRLRALARNALDTVRSMQAGLAHAMHSCPPARHADYAVALPVCAALLHHAGNNEAEAVHCARNRIFASKCRMAFGTTSIVLGSISLVLLLVLGTVSTGGLMIGMAAVLAGVAWLMNASIRSHQHAASLDAAVDDLASCPSTVPPLQQAIGDAVDLLDVHGGRGGAHPRARKVVKRMLLGLGMSRGDFRPLKWGHGAIRDRVRAELADTIFRYVAGDAMRRALDGVAPETRAFVPAG